MAEGGPGFAAVQWALARFGAPFCLDVAAIDDRS